MEPPSAKFLTKWGVVFVDNKKPGGGIVTVWLVVQ